MSKDARRAEIKRLKADVRSLQERLAAAQGQVQTLEGLLDECRAEAQRRPAPGRSLAQVVADEARSRSDWLVGVLGIGSRS